MSLLAAMAVVLVAQGPTDQGPEKLENPILSKQKEKEEMIAKLKRDIFKVDRAIGETNKLIAKSRNAPYLPDLQFRQAELYVEKSRYIYYLKAEQRPPDQKGALVSPETKLFKQKAMQIYNRILRENPDFKDGDKVTFYLAHEYRELGEFDSMLKTLGDLIHKYPSSPQRLDAEQIIGDYWFDKADLKQAEEHYKAILDAPASPTHDLARYKMGWVRINEGKHAEAVTYFEAAAASAPIPGVDQAKSLNVKREALLDLVYSYTEARPAKGALQYFEKLSESRATYSLALDKLGNRYFIKQQFEFAIPALRKLMEVQPDPELQVERAEKIYDSLKAAKAKVLPKPEDVGFLVAAAVGVKTDPAKDETARKKTLVELEEMARDLSTSLHQQAQKKDDKALYLDAAAAYERYLSLFRPKQYATAMMQNRADALFAAKKFTDAARQFEELALYLDNRKAAEEKPNDPNKLDVAKEGTAKAPKDAKSAALASVSKSDSGRTVGDLKSHQDALYGALLSHFSALKPGEVERLNAFEVSDARQALKLLGAQYLERYAKSEHALEVKFNIARAYFEDGEYPKAAELFRAFATTHPDHKDAIVAGNLALDALRQVNDFKGIEETGKVFLASNLPATFKTDVDKIMKQAKGDELGEIVILSTEEAGDMIAGLEKIASENKGSEMGEKALYGAFAAARDGKLLAKERELGQKFVQEYPKSTFLSEVMLTMARHAAEGGRMSEAAQLFDQVGAKFTGDATGLDAFLASARLKMALGDNAGAIRALESASEQAGARKAEVLVLLAQTRMKMKELPKARAVAEQILRLDPTNPSAAAIVAEAQATLSPNDKPDALVALLTKVTNSPQGGAGEDSAKALWFLGDILYKKFKALPTSALEEKIGALQQQITPIFQQSASMGSAEWAVASAWRVANSLQHLADVVEATPGATKDQIEPIRQQAAQAFQSCLDKAEQLEVFSPAVVGCRKKTDDAQNPLRGAPAERAVNVEEAQRKAESSQAAADFESLGVAYLSGYKVNDAKLALTRAIEIEDNRASAHSAMGYAMVLSGDAMAARQEYARALEADPTYEKARANVAALKCRFHDAEGAKKELSLIKDLGGLGGADVDPEWKSCK